MTRERERERRRKRKKGGTAIQLSPLFCLTRIRGHSIILLFSLSAEFDTTKAHAYA